MSETDMEKLKKIAGYFICFVLGIIFTILITPVLAIFKEPLFGYEIQSMASFPYGHMARLYTNPGLGNQNFTLEIDGKNVWNSVDAVGGDLDEKLIWDKTGRIISVELAGKKVFSYDAEFKKRIEN
jgi:hypothetical protein